MGKETEKFKSDDEFDLDKDLDFDEFNLDGAMQSDEDSRISVMGLGRSIMEDVTSKISDPRRASEVAKHFLPDQMNSDISDSLDAFDTAKELIDKSVDQAKPVVSEIATTINKLLPDSWKGAREFFNKFVQEKTLSQRTDPRKAEDERIAATLNQIFSQQMVQQESIRQEEKAEAAIKEKIDRDQSKAQYQALSNINLNLQKLSDYNSKINALYQRKSLEIQLRSFNMQANIYEMLKQYTAKSTGLFDAIMHNTAMPDFVKITKSEMFKKAFLDRTVDKTIDIVGKRGFGRFAKSVVGSLKSQLASGISGLQSFGMISMLGEMIDPSMGMTKEKVGMDLGANFITSQVTSILADKWKQSDFGRSMLGKLAKVSGKMESMPAVINGWAKKLGELAEAEQKRTGVKRKRGEYELVGSKEKKEDEEDKKRFDKLSTVEKMFSATKYGLYKMGQQILKKGVKDAGGSTSLDLPKDNAATLNNPAQFTRNVEKTITHIIPGYLARILQQLTMAVTGNRSAPMVLFDHSRGMFREDSSMKAKFFKRISDDSDRGREWYIRDLEEIKSGLFGKKKGDESIIEGDVIRDYTNEQEEALDRLMDKFITSRTYTLHNVNSFEEDFKNDILNYGKLTKEEAEKLKEKGVSEKEIKRRMEHGLFSEEQAEDMISKMKSLQNKDDATIEKLNDLGDKIRSRREVTSFDKSDLKRAIEENPESLEWFLRSGLAKRNKYDSGYEIDEDAFYKLRRYGGLSDNKNVVVDGEVVNREASNRIGLVPPGLATPVTERRRDLPTSDIIAMPWSTESTASTDLVLPPSNNTLSTPGTSLILPPSSISPNQPKSLISINTSILDTLNKMRDLMIEGVTVKGSISTTGGNVLSGIGSSFSSGMEVIRGFGGTVKEHVLSILDFIRNKKDEYFAKDPKGAILKYISDKFNMTPEELLNLPQDKYEELKAKANIKFDDLKGIIGDFKSKFADKAKATGDWAVNKLKAWGILDENYDASAAGVFGTLKDTAGSIYDSVSTRAGQMYETAKNYTKEKCFIEIQNYYNILKDKFAEGKSKLEALYNNAKAGATKEKATAKLEELEAWYKAQLELMTNKFNASKALMEEKMKEANTTSDGSSLLSIATNCYDVVKGFIGKAFDFGGDKISWVYNLAKELGGAAADKVKDAYNTVTGNQEEKSEKDLTEEELLEKALKEQREKYGEEGKSILSTPGQALGMFGRFAKWGGNAGFLGAKAFSKIAPYLANGGMGALQMLLSGGLGVGGALRVLGKTTGFFGDMGGKILGKAFGIGARILDDYKLLEGCMDLYLPGSEEPVIFKKDMEAGKYFDSKTGKPIMMLGDIRGPVVRVENPQDPKSERHVVLTINDLATGLFTNKGKNISRYIIENMKRAKSDLRRSFFGTVVGRAVGSGVGEQGKGGKTNEEVITDPAKILEYLQSKCFANFKGKDDKEKKASLQRAANELMAYQMSGKDLTPSVIKKIVKKYLKDNTDIILDTGASFINGGFRIINKHLDERSIFGRGSTLMSTILGANRGGFNTSLDDAITVDDALEYFPKNTTTFKGKDDKEKKKNAENAAKEIKDLAANGKLTLRTLKAILEKYTLSVVDRALNTGQNVFNKGANKAIDFFTGKGLGIDWKNLFKRKTEEELKAEKELEESRSTKDILKGGDGKTTKNPADGVNLTDTIKPIHFMQGLYNKLTGKGGDLTGIRDKNGKAYTFGQAIKNSINEFREGGFNAADVASGLAGKAAGIGGKIAGVGGGLAGKALHGLSKVASFIPWVGKPITAATEAAAMAAPAVGKTIETAGEVAEHLTNKEKRRSKRQQKKLNKKKGKTTAELNEERAIAKQEEIDKEKKEAQDAAAKKEVDSGLGGILGGVWNKVKKFGMIGIIGLVGAAVWKFKDQIVSVGKFLWKGVKGLWKVVKVVGKVLWKIGKIGWSIAKGIFKVGQFVGKVVWNIGKGIWWVGKKICGVFGSVAKAVGKVISFVYGIIRDNPIANFFYGDRKDPNSHGLYGTIWNGAKKAVGAVTGLVTKRSNRAKMGRVFETISPVYGAYKALERWTDSDIDEKDKLRMIQYGLGDKDGGLYPKMGKLEEFIINEKIFKVTNGNKLVVDTSKLDIELLQEVFDFDDTDDNYVQRMNLVNEWMGKRFLPTFTKHINLCQKYLGGADIENIHKAKEERLYFYLKNIKNIEGLDWSYVTSPFDTGDDVIHGSKEEFDKLYKEVIEKIPERIRNAVDKGNGNNEEAADDKSNKNVKLDKNGKPITDVNGKGKVSATSGPMYKGYKKPTALECIRFKCYGVRDIEPKYVTAMRALEEAIEDDVKDANGEMNFSMELDKLISKVGGLFDLSKDDVESDRGKAFESWFKTRFLVVYLKYIDLIYRKYKETKRERIEKALQDLDFIIEVARELIKLPIWSIKTSPWGEKYELNSDPETTKRNLNYLEQRNRSKKLSQDLGLDKVAKKGAEGKKKLANGKVDTSSATKAGGNVQGESSVKIPDNPSDQETLEYLKRAGIVKNDKTLEDPATKKMVDTWRNNWIANPQSKTVIENMIKKKETVVQQEVKKAEAAVKKSTAEVTSKAKNDFSKENLSDQEFEQLASALKSEAGLNIPVTSLKAGWKSKQFRDTMNARLNKTKETKPTTVSAPSNNATNVSSSSGSGIQGSIVGGNSSPTIKEPTEQHPSGESGQAHITGALDPATWIKGGAKEKKVDFIKKVLPSAINAYKEFNILPSFTIAQAAEESGWGQHMPGGRSANGSNNLFGVKAFGKPNPWWDGSSTVSSTGEVYGGKAVTEKAGFRKYKSWDQSIMDHGRMIRDVKNYKGIAGAKDYRVALDLLGKSGYATDPNKAKTVGSILEGNQLYRYDGIDPSQVKLPVTNVSSSSTSSSSEKSDYSSGKGRSAVPSASTLSNESIAKKTQEHREATAKKLDAIRQNVANVQGKGTISTGMAVNKENLDKLYGSKNAEQTTGDAEADKTTSTTGTSKKGSEAIENVISIMEQNAKGATYSQSKRMSPKFYDCSSFVSRNFKQAGFNVNPSNNCGTLKDDFVKAGFKWHPGKFGKNLSNLQRGDILLKAHPQGHRHVETYLGDGKIIGARTSSKPYPLGVGPRNFWDDGYEGFLRLEGTAPAGSSNNSPQTDAPVENKEMDTPTTATSNTPTTTSNVPTRSDNGSGAIAATQSSVSNSSYSRTKPTTPKEEKKADTNPENKNLGKMLDVQSQILDVVKGMGGSDELTKVLTPLIDKLIEAIRTSSSKGDPKDMIQQEADSRKANDTEGFNNSSGKTPNSAVNMKRTFIA